MTRMQIPASEVGVTRVFHIDLPPEAVDRFTTQAGTGEWPLQYALGALHLRASHVDVVALRDLGEMPLSDYLAQGYALSGPDFNAARPQLDALTGHVAIVTSPAFAGREQQLAIAAPLRWIGTFAEETRPPELTPLRSAAANGTLSGGAPATRGRGNSRLLKAIVILVAVLTALILLAALTA